MEDLQKAFIEFYEKSKKLEIVIWRCGLTDDASDFAEFHNFIKSRENLEKQMMISSINFLGKSS